MNETERNFKNRWLLLISWIVLSSILFAHPLTALLRLSASSDDASYLIVIPFISAFILFIERHKIFVAFSYDGALGGSLLVGAVCVGLVASLAGTASSFGPGLSGYILALVMLWIAGFTFLFGKAASKACYFPLLFVLLMVPLPQSLLDQVISFLQTGSAWITGAFFDLFGVPALREGFIFHLSGINIEVAKECSGIRSSMVLLILALVVAHFYLKNFWNKALFVICGLFIMILKNGIRIATLTLLAMYVNPSFLTGRLHRQGGIVFFLVGLLLLLPVLWLLQRTESRRAVARAASRNSQSCLL